MDEWRVRVHAQMPIPVLMVQLYAISVLIPAKIWIIPQNMLTFACLIKEMMHTDMSIATNEAEKNGVTATVPVFQRPVWVACFAAIAAVVWGLAYPFIKMGFLHFGITQEMTANKILFAGVRFSICGIIILLVAYAAGRPMAVRRRSDWAFVLVYALLNTTLHYAAFYIGLSYSAGSRAAILNSLGVFLLVLFACVFFRSDRLTWGKLSGCAIGFAGILTLNLGGGGSGSFSLCGDGMIVLNALCSALAGLLTRGLARRVDVFVGTGYSLAIGGLLLLFPALSMQASFPQVTLQGLSILFVLICISAVGFLLYNKLISCNPVGKVAIFNSLIPVVGAVSSCLCLGEPFYWKYMAAGVLAAAGIYIINKQKHG